MLEVVARHKSSSSLSRSTADQAAGKSRCCVKFFNVIKGRTFFPKSWPQLFWGACAGRHEAGPSILPKGVAQAPAPPNNPLFGRSTLSFELFAGNPAPTVKSRVLEPPKLW